MGCCFSSSNNNKVGDEKIETIRNKKYQQTAPKTTSQQQQPSYTTSELTEEWKSMIAGLIANNEITLHAQAKKREQFQSLREVGDYLAECQAAATELERAWLVFLWITDNISYDVEDFIANTAAEEENNNNTNNTQTNTRSTPTDAQSAYISGQAVRAGYADLYRE